MEFWNQNPLLFLQLWGIFFIIAEQLSGFAPPPPEDTLLTQAEWKRRLRLDLLHAIREETSGEDFRSDRATVHKESSLENIKAPIFARFAKQKLEGIRIEQLSYLPRASIYHNFISKEEATYLIDKALPRLDISRVIEQVPPRAHLIPPRRAPAIDQSTA
ncbi:hypothetical protein CBR_g16038 [Chara braunii]|uniref:Uncharacterized protein n=1 Tax=Chara braunii TaxID=69332 RepID=A0A388JT26_CHABU|nr:hypothetical protein CBR_g16038 [Chara braunii]|eukprot:GBG60917.1 hypothetical protein CBR_g16038 [Chara braunii]